MIHGLLEVYLLTPSLPRAEYNLLKQMDLAADNVQNCRKAMKKRYWPLALLDYMIWRGVSRPTGSLKVYNSQLICAVHAPNGIYQPVPAGTGTDPGPGKMPSDASFCSTGMSIFT